MSHLTPKAEDLVQAGRTRLQPRSADYHRVLQALLPQVGDGLEPDLAHGPAVAQPVAKALLVKLVGLLLGIGVISGGLLLAIRSAQPPDAAVTVVPAERAPSATPMADTAQQGSSVPASLPSSEPLPAAKPLTSASKPVATSHATGSLAEEVAILSRAGAELHAGRPSAALASLSEHQRRFPAGVLSQERSAARIQALCALGRTAEAKTELARLGRTSPNSPLESRARKSCGSNLNESE